MNIVCAPQGIVDIRHPNQGVGDMAKAGFERMLLDFSMCCPTGELEAVGKPSGREAKGSTIVLLYEHPEKMAEYMRPIWDQCTEGQLQCLVAKAPYLRRNTKRDDLNSFLKGLVKESVIICGQAGCHYLVVRPLFAGMSEEEQWEQNRGFYLDLAQLAKQHQVQILLENQCKDYNGHLVRGLCSDGRQAAQWVDALNEAAGEERFGFCMDVGVCNLCGQNMYDFVLSLGERLKAVILRDNDGNSDSALLPFTAVQRGQSRTDWLNLIRGLREIGFDGELIMDFHDTASAFSPLLRPGLLQMAKSVAEYFKWQIEIENVLKKYPSRVLFGAGNMCRNYMKCYGEKYPPLFT